jgi:hypothetical protein
MTPKEKAKDLVDNFIDKMFYLRDGYNASEVFATAKQCALIAVDEILKVCENEISHCSDKTYFYWEEVKQQIEKL